ncbi:thiolase domain-containing protein [bacterium]|nr:thiolase domain-containing protein [bacterium]
MRDVAVIGVGNTKFGELWEYSLRDLFVEAALKALDDAGVDMIDSIYVGTMSSGMFVDQEHIGALVADYVGKKHVPALRVESACASGGFAFRQGLIEVAGGFSDIVLVGGVEKMTDTEDATFALSSAADQDNESYFGATFPALYAMIARAHMHKYGTTRDQLAAVSVKNHNNGSLNPDAQFGRKITIEAVKKSVMVAEPLTILDCSPVTDGAACAVICPLEMAGKFKKKPIKVIGTGVATDTIALHSREDITTLKAVQLSADRAYQMAGKKPGDIDLAEVHDCFTIAEIVVTEELGFAEKGKGGLLVEEGKTALDGEIPINTSGGLKSKGHPVGATGIAQVAEIVRQLRGEAGERQIDNPKVGLTQNMGGSGASSVTHIFEVV